MQVEYLSPKVEATLGWADGSRDPAPSVDDFFWSMVLGYRRANNYSGALLSSSSISSL